MIWITLISLLFSAFFSGMEIAFLSCNKLKVEVDKKQGKYYARVISRFFEKPGELLATLLMGNNVSLVIYGISFASVLSPILLKYVVASMTGALMINILISTTIVLITADFLPKVLCRINPNGVLLRFTWLLSLFYVILFPLAKFANMLSFFFLRLFGIKATKHRERVLFNKSDLMVLSDEVENMQEEETEHGNEVHIFRNALDFSEVTVRACMIPRNEMKVIELDDSFDDLMNLFIETGFSRIPVFEHSVDHIVGYVHSKDLFVGKKTIREMLRPLRFVPEDYRAQKLLAFMTKNKKSLAVVVDEYGGTSGMVTLEDLIEEIFGEIRDESDKEAPVEEQLSEHEFIFSARLDIRYLNKTYDLNIPESEAYETLAGYITHLNEAIPKELEKLQFENIMFTIISTSPTRIETVNVRLLDEK
ncbi:MAG: hemolysin family protein [Bacteroidales bacterium]|nr:hemolysin family protein [Bacteroidales bacterium]